MSYTNRVGDDVITEPTVVGRVADYHDRVRWGPIISGLFIGLATQIILSALFAAIGASTIEASVRPRIIAPDVANNVSIWSTIALLISLFTAGWVTARACGPMNRSTALLNGAILWATTMAASSWLLASGVTGAFGIVASNAADILNQQNVTIAPGAGVTDQQAQEIAEYLRRSLWWFVFGSFLGLIAAMIGAVVGARSPRRHANYNT
jgi:hypothetical protein